MMLRRLVPALFLLVPVAVICAPATAGVLYGLSSSSPGIVYTIDGATGAATQLITMDRTTSLVGLEYLNGRLYATDVLDPGFSFGSIDPATGAFTPINTQAGSANWHSLAANPALNVFYSVNLDSAGYDLVSIALAGTVSVVGPTAQELRGLAYDPVHQILYGVDPTRLFVLDPTTGVATLIGSLGIEDYRPGLAYDGDGQVLYLNAGEGHQLYSVSVTTGLATLIGGNGTSNRIDGLAYAADTAIPEPATLLLLAVGLSILVPLSLRSSKTRS